MVWSESRVINTKITCDLEFCLIGLVKLIVLLFVTYGLMDYLIFSTYEKLICSEINTFEYIE